MPYCQEGDDCYSLCDALCPVCGAPCLLDTPQTPDDLVKIDCYFCSYREGY